MSEASKSSFLAKNRQNRDFVEFWPQNGHTGAQKFLAVHLGFLIEQKPAPAIQKVRSKGWKPEILGARVKEPKKREPITVLGAAWLPGSQDGGFFKQRFQC